MLILCIVFLGTWTPELTRLMLSSVAASNYYEFFLIILATASVSRKILTCHWERETGGLLINGDSEKDLLPLCLAQLKFALQRCSGQPMLPCWTGEKTQTLQNDNALAASSFLWSQKSLMHPAGWRSSNVARFSIGKAWLWDMWSFSTMKGLRWLLTLKKLKRFPKQKDFCNHCIFNMYSQGMVCFK